MTNITVAGPLFEFVINYFSTVVPANSEIYNCHLFHSSMKKLIEGKVPQTMSINDLISLDSLPTKEAKIIFMLKKGYTYEFISKFVKVSKTTIRYTKTRMEEGIQTQFKTIYKKDICKDEIETLRLRYPHLSDSRIAELVTQNVGIEISRATINRVERTLRFRYLPMKSRPKLKIHQIEKRILFARQILKEGITGDRIIFSDESRFVRGTDNRWVWRRRGENVDEIYSETDKYPESVMIFGAIGKNFKSNIVMINGTIGAEDYQKILEESLVLKYMSENGNENLVFQQDGASCHTASAGFLRKHCNLLGMWPPNSPDLNVIEHLWAIIKRKVEEVNPPDLQSLIETIKNAWDSVQITSINNLVESFQRRCALVLHYDGANLNGHFHEPINLPTQIQINDLTGNNEIESVVLRKFNEEEISAYEREKELRAKAPIWDKVKDANLIKYIIDKGLSFSQAARRLKTTDVESLRSRFKELLREGGRN